MCSLHEIILVLDIQYTEYFSVQILSIIIHTLFPVHWSCVDFTFCCIIKQLVDSLEEGHLLN